MPRRQPDTAPDPVRRSLRILGEHCAIWRKLRGLTEQQLADRAGVARDTVRRLQEGRPINSDSLVRILHALDALDAMVDAVDPLNSGVGRLRAEEGLPQRVRPRSAL